jgi:DNA-binding GntR family transcriptional regulator
VSKPSATRGAEVYEVLRAELLSGDLQPGQKLRMVELARRLGVSQSVVREALTRLGEQGLAVASPQRGFRVHPLSVADVAGLTEARVEIESVALRLAIERGDIQWETRLVAAYHLLECTPVVNDDEVVDERWAARHSDFHRTLIAGCGNRRLGEVVQALRDSAELYRRWYWALAGDDSRDVAAEHRELKNLALARDAHAAVAALACHINRAPNELIAYADRHGLGVLSALPPSDP